MAVYDAPKNTYSDTGNAVRAISDVIQLIDPVDTPLLAALGGLNGASSKFRIRNNATKIEWVEDAYAPLTGAVANGTVAFSTTTTVFTVADGSIFKAGQVIAIPNTASPAVNEYMVISSVSGDDVTVTSRTYGGTQATHATDAAIEIVGMARVEGATASFDSLVDITEPYNYTSIFQKGLKITGTEMVVDEYGYGDVWTYQANKSMPEMFRLIEKQIFHGIRAAGTATTPRSMGGLGVFITDNSVNGGGAIAKTDIDNLAEYIMIDGGQPDLLVLHPSVANDLRALLDTSSFVNVTQENTAYGMQAIERVRTQYGEFRMVVDRFCPLSKAYMLDSRKIGLYTLRPFGWKPLGRTGDFDSAELVGEISIAVANDSAHGWIYGLTS
jgi:hypothetical protein